ARLAVDDRAMLARLSGVCEWIWIKGNHDPEPPPGLGGGVAAEYRRGPLVFRHQASEETIPTGEVSGHFHPKAIVRTRGRALHARCFATDGRRLVLPAFGAYAGGLNVLDPAMRLLFAGALQVHALGDRRVHAIAASHLLPN
ncbi:MAG: phosphoesterase, partial [Alphaproteobacteria bacterium]